MTLHWWMHWFWITQLLPVIVLLFVMGHCAPEGSPEPLDRDPLNLTTSHETNSSTRTSKSLPAHPVDSVTDRVKDADLSEVETFNVSDSENVNASTIDPLSNSSLEKLGRAASRSLEDIPSVAPVSKSRIAGPLSNGGHRGGLDAAAITGIALGIVVFAGLAGAVSFVVYRRRYLNKPQTLNDKCSNPDSSGYIDDSTLRENSEEMYSLDNDSFLNSLEAMTIQNYWTDNVKHTKL